MKWTEAELQIVSHATSRDDAYRKIRAAGFKRTQGSVWLHYRLWKQIK